MMSPNNEGDRVAIFHFFLPNDLSSTWVGIHSIELMAKGVPWKNTNNPGCCTLELVYRAGLKSPLADGNTFNYPFENWEFPSVPREKDLSPRSSWAYGNYSVFHWLADEGFLTSWTNINIPKTPWEDTRGLRVHESDGDIPICSMAGGEDPRVTGIDGEDPKSSLD